MIYESDGRPVGDAEYFAVIRGAMKVLNFTSEDEANIWSVVAMVMHLGNIEFGGTYLHANTFHYYYSTTALLPWSYSNSVHGESIQLEFVGGVFFLNRPRFKSLRLVSEVALKIRCLKYEVDSAIVNFLLVSCIERSLCIHYRG